MGSRRICNLAANDVDMYLTTPKLINSDIVFNEYPRKSKKSPYGFKEWQSTYILSVEQGDVIENLFLTLKSMIQADYWYHSFKFFIRDDDQQHIFYQMEIYPDDIVSHTNPDGSFLFGAHVHKMNQVQEVRPQNYSSFSWYEWLEYFKSNTNISIRGNVTAPNDGDLDLW